jgi:hypothetical protein
MREILTQDTEIKKSISKFRKILANAATARQEREWTFPNGEKELFETFSLHTTHGTLLVGIHDRWNNRVPHLFCLEREGRALSPDVELNIPLSLDRSVSGAYLRDMKDVWLCTRGGFTSFRGKIKREVAFKHFDKWLVDVSDNGKDARVIPVASLSSPTMVEDLAEFVQAVISLKEDFKRSSGDSISISAWSDWDEFEGKKAGAGGSAIDSYEYIHGPLCNRLNTWLKKWLKKRNNDVTIEVRRNKNIDEALVKSEKAVAIFEVKTVASLSAQIYTAIGQLFYYKHRYGSDNCALFLVLPATAVAKGFKIGSFLADIGINTIVGRGSEFKTIDGKPLSRVLNQLMTA